MGKLTFFILDIVPGPKKDILFLFGKSKAQESYINTCVQVTGIQREIYIMPKMGVHINDV